MRSRPTPFVIARRSQLLEIRVRRVATVAHRSATPAPRPLKPAAAMESSPPKYNGARYTVKVTPKKFGSTAPSCSTCGKSVYAAEQGALLSLPSFDIRA